MFLLCNIYLLHRPRNNLISFGCLGSMWDQRQLSCQIIWGKCSKQLLCFPVCQQTGWLQLPGQLCQSLPEMVHPCSSCWLERCITNNKLPNVQISDRSNLWESSIAWKKIILGHHCWILMCQTPLRQRLVGGVTAALQVGRHLNLPHKLPRLWPVQHHTLSSSLRKALLKVYVHL